jgi:DNA-binding transcriptional regulator YiaG
MAKHAGTVARTPPEGGLCVLDGQHRVAAVAATRENVLEQYDASHIVGLRIHVHNAAIRRVDEDGEATIELPDLQKLLASAAVARCLMPVRLKGWEIKAMRKIMQLTLAEMAERLDERTAPETVSRWESEAQPMGGFAEKILRLVICEGLHEDAPGVDYNASMIAAMHPVDPWRANPEYEVPYLNLVRVRLKEQSGSIIETWDAKAA